MNLDLQRYAELFRTESREQLSAINRALLQLEEGADTAGPVDGVFRAVHTMKGMSAAMGYHAVAEFAHEVESLLDRLRRGEQMLSPELIDALFAAADALEAGVDTANEDAIQSPAMVDALQRLHDVAGGSATSEFRAVQVTATGALVDISVLPVADAPGVLVRVQQAANAMLPGVRAFMAIAKLREIGDVTAVEPAIEVIQSADQPQTFTLRLVTTAGAAEIEAAVRAAGDIEHVEITMGDSAVDSGVTAVPSRRSTDVAGLLDEGASQPFTRTTRHVRIDLTRLDALMNLIGELVITRGRLLQLTASIDDAALEESMQQAARLIGDLQAEIMTSRMVPVGQVFDRFPRLVRDAARHRELFGILLENAARYTPSGGGVTASLGLQDGRVLVRIVDTGIGFDEDDRAHLFERLYRGERARRLRPAGTGLGLAIARWIVDSHGGTIELANRPGGGTIATVSLPGRAS